MIRRMLGKEGISASALSRETGVAQPTLSRWVREPRTVDSMTNSNDKKSPKSPRDWSPLEKIQAVLEAAELNEEELGDFLRRKGLQLDEWRTSVQAALAPPKRRKKGKATPEQKRITNLEREIRRKDRALAEVTALLALKKKSPGDLGGRGRRHGHEERDLILGLVDEAVHAGARQHKACEVLGIDPRTVQRWIRQEIGEDRRAGPRRPPRNKLSPAERRSILDLVNAPEYRDLSPKQIVPLLADRGRYVGSESTLYRVLREEKLLAYREASSGSVI